VAIFQEGDKVLIIGGERTVDNWSDADDELVGKIGTIKIVFEYPTSGLMTDYLVEVDGDEVAIEENYLTKVTVTELTSGEVTPKQPRVNYLYVVEDEDGAYAKTFDRSYAREIKAELGGKKAGVIITAYAAVKEIR